MRKPRRGTSWWRPVLTIVVPVLVTTAAAVTVLFKVLAPGTPTDRLDAVRTGLAVGAGIGALITLALALRRQQATEHDATERRLTELYVKAIDQLGSDKAAVRHGGLYALERTAQDNPAHRQTIVDVICAYLRSPYTPPRAPGTSKLNGLRAPLRPARARPQPPRDPDTTPNDADQEARQEREVRLTAQRILRDHLQPRTPARSWWRWFPRPAHTFWPDIDLDLTDATLINLDLRRTHIRNTRFEKARFIGDAGFDGARFGGGTWFTEARFDGAAWFEEARFGIYAGFDRGAVRRYRLVQQGAVRRWRRVRRGAVRRLVRRGAIHRRRRVQQGAVRPLHLVRQGAVRRLHLVRWGAVQRYRAKRDQALPARYTPGHHSLRSRRHRFRLVGSNNRPCPPPPNNALAAPMSAVDQRRVLGNCRPAERAAPGRSGPPHKATRAKKSPCPQTDARPSMGAGITQWKCFPASRRTRSGRSHPRRSRPRPHGLPL